MNSSTPDIDFDLDEVIQESQVDASRCGVVWLLARGLQAELADLRIVDDEPLRPCPDIDPTVDLLAGLTEAAVAAADRVRELAGGPMTPEIEQEIRTAGIETMTFTASAEAVLRRLFLAIVGVAAAFPDSSRVSRIDRAAVDQWAISGEYLRSFQEDGLHPMSTTLDEFEAELSGIIARLILDGGSQLFIDLDTDDDDADTIIVIPVADGSVVYATTGEGSEPVSHPDPVHPSHVAAHLVEAMRELGGDGIETLDRVGVFLFDAADDDDLEEVDDGA